MVVDLNTQPFVNNVNGGCLHPKHRLGRDYPSAAQHGGCRAPPLLPQIAALLLMLFRGILDGLPHLHELLL